MEKYRSGPQPKSQNRPITRSAGIEDQDRGYQLQYARPDAPPGLHAQDSEQVYGLGMGGKFKIQGLQHDQGGQDTEGPAYGVPNFHGYIFFQLLSASPCRLTSSS